MVNIQKYKSFISENKKRLMKSCIDLISYIKSDMFPLMEEIIESEEENFKSYKLKLVNDDDDEITERNFSEFDSDTDMWRICVSIKFSLSKRENEKLLKRLIDRIVVEFFDIEYDYMLGKNGEQIYFKIK